MTGPVSRVAQPRRCAIYTRKSSEAGLEQAFNSLHAQREACEAYIKSQAHEGWVLRPTAYDDGGLSGGSLERPALQALLSDIRADLIDVVVVYKVDRLSRSLADFARLVELFEQHGVSFVSVTQHFNTSSSMGRLTLNVLLSFAQFEREVTGERIRDKIAASKRKGMWMGGAIPIGYDVEDKQLVANPAEADTVRHIYNRYLALGCVRRLKEELDAEGYVSKVRGNGSGGKPFARGALYTLLRNPTYVGDVGYKGRVYPGEHAAILERDLWERVQALLEHNRSRAKSRSAAKAPSLLAGLLFDSKGHPMSPTHATKGQKRYRYYISQAVLRYVEGAGGSVLRISASDVECVVGHQIKGLLLNPQRIASACEHAGLSGDGLCQLLEQAEALANRWDKTKPGEMIRLLQRIVVRVVLRRKSVDTELDPNRMLEVLVPDLAPMTSGPGTATELLIRTPMRLKRRGLRARLIIAEPSDQAAPSGSKDAIQTALRNALRWNAALLNGDVQTLTRLSQVERVHPRYLSKLIRLSHLAPDIQQDLLKGKVPADLTLDKLLTEMPASWRNQRLSLGIPT